MRQLTHRKDPKQPDSDVNVQFHNPRVQKTCQREGKYEKVKQQTKNLHFWVEFCTIIESQLPLHKLY